MPGCTIIENIDDETVHVDCTDSVEALIRSSVADSPGPLAHRFEFFEGCNNGGGVFAAFLLPGHRFAPFGGWEI